MKGFAIVVSVLLALCTAVFEKAAAEEGGSSSTPQVVKMTAKKYDFDPATVTVTRGQPVRIEATAIDHDHGIEIKEFGVKQRLEKGKMTVIEFTPDKVGEFTFHCSVFCGMGHRGMKGKLVVVEPAKP